MSPGKPKMRGDPYQVALKRALGQVVAEASIFLNKDLWVYSCKFAAAIKKLETCPGSALVYSNFRVLEGLALFGEALRAHGYAEMVVHLGKDGVLIHDHLGQPLSKDDYTKPKFVKFVGGGSIENNQLLIDIHNNNWDNLPASIRATVADIAKACGVTNNNEGKIVKVFMIAQSGAEGITLKNVRHVHLMEPYWNSIRLDQVIGRAVRTCSHTDLKPEDRTVDVYKYITKIPPNFLKNEKKLLQKDGGLTADQLVMKIAVAKTKVMNEVLDMIKMTAYDCSAHRALHKNSCYSFDGTGDPQEPAYKIDLELDKFNHQVTEPIIKVVGKGVGVRMDIGGTVYLMNKATKELYDYKLMKRGVLKYRRKLVEQKRGDKKGYIII